MPGAHKRADDSPFSPKLGALFGAARRRRIFPGAVLSAAHDGRVVHERAYGHLTYAPWSPRVRPSTVYDLASLTKPLATALSVLALVAEGRLDLSMTLRGIFSDCPPDKAGISLAHLLSHRSGLPAYRPYYQDLVRVASAHRGAVLRGHIWSEPLLTPPGSEACYSDLGFLILGQVVEWATGLPLDRAFEALVSTPLGIEGLAYRRHASCPMEPGAGSRERPPERGCTEEDQVGQASKREWENCAPTEVCDWRGGIVWGEVHDRNAWVLGGVAGHAGLFGTARAAAVLLLRLLDIYQGRSVHPLFPKALLEEFFRPLGCGQRDTWALGFDTPSAKGSSAGRLFSPRSVGHLGFTGTSFWLDLEKGSLVVLLTNRVFPQADARNQAGLRDFRPRLHDEVARHMMHLGAK